jgi:hypothetical protein
MIVRGRASFFEFARTFIDETLRLYIQFMHTVQKLREPRHGLLSHGSGSTA